MNLLSKYSNNFSFHFSFQEFSLGFDVVSEINSDPDAVDLLISFTQAGTYDFFVGDVFM